MGTLSKKKARPLLVLCLTFLFCSLALAEHIKLEPGAELRNETIDTPGAYKYYKFTVDPSFDGQSDITIKTALTEEHPWANPNIYLGKDVEYPNATDTFQIACTSFGEDICTINKNEIKPNETWYVGVSCTDSRYEDKTCAYDIVLEYVQEIILTLGEPVTVYLYEDEERIFKVFVDEDPEIRHVQIATRGKDVFSKFQMLTVKGNDPPGTDRRKHSWPAWNNGYVSRFEPGCDCFCRNCNYTAMIQADTEGYYTIIAKTSKTVESIKNGEIYDTVFRGRNNCYDTYVNNPYNDFRVKMKVYSGDPDMFVHPGNLPLFLRDFKYSSQERMESEELVLTPEMREDDENVVGVYYICVLGQWTSSFKIETHTEANSTHMLEAGLAETAYLNQGEFVNYWYRDDILKEKTNLTFQLHAFTGAETLRSQLCSVDGDLKDAKKKCMHSKEDLTKPIPNEPMFSQIGFETFEHDPSTCNEGNPIMGIFRYQPPSCMYNIGVLATGLGRNHFGVTIRHNEGHHVLLTEGQTIEGSVVQGEYNYFKISIHDPEVDKFTIQLLTIHGDPDLFESQKDEFPSNSTYERKATICGMYPDTLEFKKDANKTDLTGDYYLAVFGSRDSSYHLYYQTERSYEDDEGNSHSIKLPVKLQQSKASQGVLKSKDDYAKFTFNIANTTNEEEIVVHLTPQNGKFKFYVKHAGEASPSNYDKMGSQENHYTVVFDPNSEPGYNNGQFNIYVEPILTEDLSESGMSYTYLLSYNIGSHHIPLLNNQPTTGYTSGEKINYYSYVYRTETDEIHLTSTVLNGNMEIIVSMDPNTALPTWEDVNRTEGVISLKNGASTIGSDVISKYCSHDDYGYCIMIIAIRSTSPTVEAGYVLLAVAVDEDSTSIYKVENGVPQQGVVKAGQWQYYYMKTSNNSALTAVVVPNGGDPNIFVTVMKDLNQKIETWGRPTEANYLKKSEDTIGADLLLLSQEDLKECANSCIVIFGVQGRSVSSQYTLTVSRGIARIRDNHVFSDSLGANGNYKFYEYYRKCSGCTTVVTVSSLQNSPVVLFSNFNKTDTPISEPDEKADFSARGRGSVNLVITPDDLIAKGHKDEPGYFFIEVHSHQDFNYTIAASTEGAKMYPISRGTPASFTLEMPGDHIYYTYKHDSSKGFIVYNQMDYGYVDMFINAVPEGEDIGQNLPDDAESSEWTTLSSDSHDMLEISNSHREFCRSCTYVVKLVAGPRAKGFLAIQEQGKQSSPSQMTVIKLGQPTAVTMQDEVFNHFKFVVPDDKPVRVTVNTLSGDTEFEITESAIKDTEFGKDGDRNSTVVFKGNNENNQIILENSGCVNTGCNNWYYLTLKSVSFYSRAVITVGHVGEYNYISEFGPQTAYMSNISMFYAYIDPTPGTAKVIVEVEPQTKREKFTLYAKVVEYQESAIYDEEIPVDTEQFETPEWELTSEEVIKGADKHFTYDNSDKKKRKTHMVMDVEIPDFEENSDSFTQKVLLIAVKPDNDNSPNAQVNVYYGASSIQTLEYGVTHFGYVMNAKDTFKLYELYIPYETEDSFVVELMPCYGRAEMFVAKNFNKLLKNEYKIKATHMTNGRLYAVLENHHKNKDKKFMIAVKSFNNATDDYKDFEITEFSIEVKRMPKTVARDTYVERYYVPKDGEIDYEFVDGGDEILLTWPQVYNAEGTEPLAPEQVAYDVYVSFDTSVGLESPCSLEYMNYPLNEEILYENQYKIDVEDDLEDFDDFDAIYFNVIAYIDENADGVSDSYSEYSLVYHPLKIKTENIEHYQEVGGWFWYIAILTIVILMLIIIFFYRRYKKVQKKLDFEVREVRHGVDFGQELKETKVYNRFSQQDAAE